MKHALLSAAVLLAGAVPASATGVTARWLLLTLNGAPQPCPGSSSVLVRKAEADALVARGSGETAAFCLREGLALRSTAVARRKGSMWWVEADNAGRRTEFFASPSDFLLNPEEVTDRHLPPPARPAPAKDARPEPGALERSLAALFPDAEERKAVAWHLTKGPGAEARFKEFRADLAAADRPGWESVLRSKWGPAARRALAQACDEPQARRRASKEPEKATAQLEGWWGSIAQAEMRDAVSGLPDPRQAGLCPASRRETPPGARKRETAAPSRRETAPPARRRETAAPPPPAAGPAASPATRRDARPGVPPRPSGNDGAWKRTAALGAGAAALGVAGLLAFGPVGLAVGLLLGGALGWELGKGL